MKLNEANFFYSETTEAKLFLKQNFRNKTLFLAKRSETFFVVSRNCFCFAKFCFEAKFFKSEIETSTSRYRTLHSYNFLSLFFQDTKWKVAVDTFRSQGWAESKDNRMEERRDTSDVKSDWTICLKKKCRCFQNTNRMGDNGELQAEELGRAIENSKTEKFFQLEVRTYRYR